LKSRRLFSSPFDRFFEDFERAFATEGLPKVLAEYRPRRIKNALADFQHIER
jgi:hypothetical protein